MTEWRWYIAIGAFVLMLISIAFTMVWTFRAWKNLIELEAEYRRAPEEYKTIRSRYAFMFRHCGEVWRHIGMWVAVFFLSILISYIARS